MNQIIDKLITLNKSVVLPEVIDGEQPEYFLSNDPDLYKSIYSIDGKTIKLNRCVYSIDGYAYMYVPFEYQVTDIDILKSQLDFLAMMSNIELP